jgi:hypothetical protein
MALAVLLIDQIPNAAANAMFWLLVGVGLGYGNLTKTKSINDPVAVVSRHVHQPHHEANAS